MWGIQPNCRQEPNLIVAGQELVPEERAALLDLPYKQKDVKYKSVRACLKKSTRFPDSARFVGLSYRADEKDPEATLFVHMKGWHTLAGVLEKAGLIDVWNGLSGDHAKLDRLAFILKPLHEVHP